MMPSLDDAFRIDNNSYGVKEAIVRQVGGYIAASVRAPPPGT